MQVVRWRSLTPRCRSLSVGAVCLISILAAGCSRDEKGTTFNLSVMSAPAGPPDVRVIFTASTTRQEAEVVQDQLTRQPTGLRSVLRSPFRALDVTFEDVGGDGHVERMRAALGVNPAVERIDACPCSDLPPGPDKTQVATPLGEPLHLVQRSCGTSRRPRPIAGCVTEFELVQPRPVEGCSGWYGFVFDARASTVQGKQVRRLTGRLTTGGPSSVTRRVPPVDGRLTPDRHTLPIKIFQFYFGAYAYQEEAEVSPGRIDIDFSQARSHAVSIFPDAPGASRAKLKGAAEVCLPAPQQFVKQYEVVGEIQ